ncbi:pectinesterase inhibitor 7-like [Aristolochia californica]|uniref:pectinesterase inhibitor 7-like n=1 Tax=Aristolochia californica TaxID=171875 RepID=UPI0035D7AD29
MGAANGVIAGALFVVLCFLLPDTISAMLPAQRPALSPESANRVNYSSSEFINNSCGKTEYPDVCLSTLRGYADTVHDNPRQLAQMAISVTLRRSRRASAYVSYVIHSNTVNDHYVQEVLGDCQDTLGNAVDEIKDSLGELRKMTDPGSGEFKFQLSNAQTWMSAALSNVDTCSDEFDKVQASQLKSNVVDRVKRMRTVTANALALVNLCAA